MSDTFDNKEQCQIGGSMRQAVVFGFILSTIGGAWVFRDYVTGEISNRGYRDRTPAQAAPAVEPPPAYQQDTPETHDEKKDKNKWRKTVSPADETQREDKGRG